FCEVSLIEEIVFSKKEYSGNTSRYTRFTTKCLALRKLFFGLSSCMFVCLFCVYVCLCLCVYVSVCLCVFVLQSQGSIYAPSVSCSLLVSLICFLFYYCVACQGLTHLKTSQGCRKFVSTMSRLTLSHFVSLCLIFS